jgi:hypothetical protein
MNVLGQYLNGRRSQGRRRLPTVSRILILGLADYGTIVFLKILDFMRRSIPRLSHRPMACYYSFVTDIRTLA